ncbi:hypothetical protein ACH5RR_031892 [Cinchona calisaya]|uniref:Uncharacterized protein n=1 Tax=Cinchona calisaya TaxID=153742 RepID=A0ABD2YGJ9_9GENT
MGVKKVTFSTSLSATTRMIKQANTSPEGLSIVPFSDGYDNGVVWGSDDIRDFLTSLISNGSQAMRGLITAKSNESRPITHVIYTPFMPFVSQVAYERGISSTLLWTQTAAVLDIYYCNFSGYSEKIEKITSSEIVELPGLPLLKVCDLPSFLLDSCPDVNRIALEEMKVHFEPLEKEQNGKILVNTFDSLEYEALRALKKFKILAIGPLVPSAFLSGTHDSLDASFRGDMMMPMWKDYVKWLNSKDERSLVYVAFGSYSELPIEQNRRDCKRVDTKWKAILVGDKKTIKW